MRKSSISLFLTWPIFLLGILCFTTCTNSNKNNIINEISEPTPSTSIHHPIDIALDSNLEAKVDSLFQKALMTAEIPGAAVAILKGNKIILQKAYGYSNANSKTPLSTQSVFRIGSLSKSLTGVLSGILYQKGEIDYAEKVINFDEDCSLNDPEYSQELNLSHLLSHTSGLPYHSFTNLIEYGLPLSKIVCKFEEIKNLVPPGSIYSYQNAVFAESIEVISRKLKIQIEDIYMNNLFGPLGMKTASTSFKALKETKDIAKPHKKSGNKWLPQPINKKYFNAIPAGGINASIEDMTKIMNAMLGNQPSILSTSSIDTITTPRIDTKVKYRYYKKWENFDNSYYGYGWRIHTFKNPNSQNIDTLIHHGGQVNNYRSEIAIDKKEKIAICVLFNGYTSLANTIIPKLLALVKESKKGPIQEEQSL